MSVELQPEELGFRRPFDHEVTEVLKITNTNKSPVAFKVKTTAPKQYCVRPNSGIVPAESNVEVQVLLQAMKEDPPLDARCRDKFLVQSVGVNSEDEANIASLWQNIEKTAKSSIQEKKIRVQFLPAAHSATAAGLSTPNGPSTHDETTTAAHGPPSPNFGSPLPPAEKKAVIGNPDNVKAAAADAAEATGVASAVAAVSNAIPTSQEELKKQLADAQAQISKLTNQLADPQLRQRKVQEATEKVQAVVQQSSDAGVPLQIVAGLCLLSFLIAYFFF